MGCTVCAVSVLNTLSPKIQDVLVSEVVPGDHVSIRFLTTIMAAQGDIAVEALNETAKLPDYLLIIECTIPTKDNGVYSTVGQKQGKDVLILEHTLNLSQRVIVTILDCQSKIRLTKET